MNKRGLNFWAINESQNFGDLTILLIEYKNSKDSNNDEKAYLVQVNVGGEVVSNKEFNGHEEALAKIYYEHMIEDCEEDNADMRFYKIVEAKEISDSLVLLIEYRKEGYSNNAGRTYVVKEKKNDNYISSKKFNGYEKAAAKAYYNQLKKSMDGNNSD